MKAKKFLSILLSLAMAVTAFAAFAVNASAESIENSAKSVTNGKTYTTTLEKGSWVQSGKPVDYKITATKAGTLTLNITSYSKTVYINVYDKDGNNISEDSHKVTTGSVNNGCIWDSTMEKFVGKRMFPVKKGTYFIRIQRGDSYGNGKFIVKFSFPSSSSDSSNIKINNLTLTMKVGDKIQLGTALSASTDDNVAWKSSKTSVAKVSATGLVTAKAAGTTTITATIGSSTQKIDIKVTK